MKNVVIGFCPVEYKDPRRKCSQMMAIEVLEKTPYWVFPLAFGFENDTFNRARGAINALNLLKRNSRIEIGNTRDLPYIKEILDFCAKVDCKTIGYINSDIMIGQEFYDAIQEQDGAEAYIFQRNDSAHITSGKFMDGERKVIYGGDRHIGADGFFFNRQWWIKNRDKFPDDLIIGETEWDTCYKTLIKRYTNKYIERRVLFHEYHNAKWTLRSPGARNNISIWEDVKND